MEREGLVEDFSDPFEVGTDEDAPALEHLQADAAGDAQRCRETAGEVSATPHISGLPVLEERSVVRVGGAGFVQKFGIVRGVLVFVLDDGRQGEPAGREVPVLVFGDTGQEVGTVRFVAGGRELTGAGTTAV